MMSRIADLDLLVFVDDFQWGFLGEGEWGATGTKKSEVTHRFIDDQKQGIKIVAFCADRHGAKTHCSFHVL